MIQKVTKNQQHGHVDLLDQTKPTYGLTVPLLVKLKHILWHKNTNLPEQLISLVPAHENSWPQLKQLIITNSLSLTRLDLGYEKTWIQSE